MASTTDFTGIFQRASKLKGSSLESNLSSVSSGGLPSVKYQLPTLIDGIVTRSGRNHFPAADPFPTSSTAPTTSIRSDYK